MDESVYCKMCCKKCSNTTELKTHIESHKKHPRTDDGERPNKSLKKNTDAGEKPSKSLKKKNSINELPTKSLKKKNSINELPTKSLKKHKDGDTGLPTKSPKKNDKLEKFTDYNRVERKYVECNVCQEICADETALRRHCELHLFQKHTKCGVCSKDFRSVYALHDHFNSHKSYIYACNICDEQFKTKEGLTRHNCSKSYPCNVCNQVFKSKDELLSHFFIHKSLQGSYLHFTSD